MSDHPNDRETAAYRSALALFTEHLYEELGEDGLRRLAKTSHEHVTLVLLHETNTALKVQVRVAFSALLSKEDVDNAIRTATNHLA